MNFRQKIAHWAALRTFFLAGLDITAEHIPADFLPNETHQSIRLRHFVCHIIDLTAPYCCGWKPNLAFYEGSDGRLRLEQVCEYISRMYPDYILLPDNKDGDIGTTNDQDVKYYKKLGFDGFTANPLMGFEGSMETFLSDPDFAVFLLCLTSNKGSQDILRGPSSVVGMQFLFQQIADYARDNQKWNKNGNLHLVVGGTNSLEDIASIRQHAGEGAIFLMPGYSSKQGGAFETVKAAVNSQGGGILPMVASDLVTPKRDEGESFDDAVVRTALFYKEKFAGLVAESV